MDAPPPARRVPRLAVTLGDPRGIGAEVTRKALADPRVAAAALLVPIGAEQPDIADVHSVGRWPTAGDPLVEAGRIAARAVEAATALAAAGEVDGIVTAPLDKAALHAAGWHHPGHTEMLQALCGAPAVAMLMAAEHTRLGGALRVVLMTTHLPLRAVPDRLTGQLVEEQARLADGALRAWWDLPAPRLALCALNPHASDGGLFGDEEARVLRPAVERLRGAGLAIDGPIPADTVFARALDGEFDAVLAPYHDVGMAAFKTAAFGSGVNVTLGLPFPRTSPDHGTAIDIAGLGRADAGSMIEAILLAARLAARFDRPAERI